MTKMIIGWARLPKRKCQNWDMNLGVTPVTSALLSSAQLDTCVSYTHKPCSLPPQWGHRHKQNSQLILFVYFLKIKSMCQNEVKGGFLLCEKGLLRNEFIIPSSVSPSCKWLASGKHGSEVFPFSNRILCRILLLQVWLSWCGLRSQLSFVFQLLMLTHPGQIDFSQNDSSQEKYKVIMNQRKESQIGGLGGQKNWLQVYHCAIWSKLIPTLSVFPHL